MERFGADDPVSFQVAFEGLILLVLAMTADRSYNRLTLSAVLLDLFISVFLRYLGNVYRGFRRSIRLLANL